MAVLVFCARDGQVRMIIGSYFQHSHLISLHISRAKPMLLFTSLLVEMLQQLQFYCFQCYGQGQR